MRMHKHMAWRGWHGVRIEEGSGRFACGRMGMAVCVAWHGMACRAPSVHLHWLRERRECLWRRIGVILQAVVSPITKASQPACVRTSHMREQPQQDTVRCQLGGYGWVWVGHLTRAVSSRGREAQRMGG